MSEINQFSRRQQQAILGHTFSDSALWSQLDELGVDKTWFEGPEAQVMFEGLAKHRQIYKGHQPSVMDFSSYLTNVDSMEAPSRIKFVNECVQIASAINLDIIRQKLGDWAKSRFISQSAIELGRLYNAGDHSGAFDIWKKGALELEKIDASAGTLPDKLMSSPSRMVDEVLDRVKDGKNIIEYGISFLDDILCGIISHDLIMVGARSGSGKTELAKIVAGHNAKKGKRVAFFALEAEEAEIERRIKFSILISYWEKDNEGVSGAKNFGYAEWRLGKYKDSLDRDDYTLRAEAEYAKDYSTLKTYYRVSGDFGINDLDREILRIHTDVDLIIIDHLHYFDLEGENENLQMKKLVKRLRSMALCLGIPILCIAHLKKIGVNSLIPSMNDFHGSSDITKIATTCIMLSSCDGFVPTEDGTSHGISTFVRIAKFRLDGTRTKYVGMALYDKQKGCYLDKYAIGQLNLAETAWTPMTGNPPYWVNAKNVLKEISEVS